jgi:protein-disulfide isomerase
MNRRKFIGTLSSGVLAGLAGCQIPNAERVQTMPRPYAGSEESDVVVKVFEDFACPACAEYSTSVKPQIFDEYVEGNEIRYEHYDYPLPVHQRWSYEIANAARSVQDRSDNETFFEFTDAIFEDQDTLSQDLVRDIANNLDGVDNADGVVNDGAASLYEPVIQSDRQVGSDEYNVQGTPTVVVNGTVASSYDYEVVSAAIESEL